MKLSNMTPNWTGRPISALSFFHSTFRTEELGIRRGAVVKYDTSRGIEHISHCCSRMKNYDKSLFMSYLNKMKAIQMPI